MKTITTEELCQRYETKVGRFRVRPMTEDEIIIETWARICHTLEERSFREGIDGKTKKCMRLAAREIRCVLAKTKHVNVKDESILKGAESQCYSVASEKLEQMMFDADLMARLITGGHALKRRLNACRIRLVHAIAAIGDNIQDLKIAKFSEEA